MESARTQFSMLCFSGTTLFKNRQKTFIVDRVGTNTVLNALTLHNSHLQMLCRSNRAKKGRPTRGTLPYGVCLNFLFI